MLQRFSVFALTLLLTTPSHLATSQALVAHSSRSREPFPAPSLTNVLHIPYHFGPSELRALPYLRISSRSQQRNNPIEHSQRLPTAGSAEDDGWLSSDNGHLFDSNPMYAGFYRAINLRNRWAYMSVTGNDTYGSPRQVRLGLAVRI